MLSPWSRSNLYRAWKSFTFYNRTFTLTKFDKHFHKQSVNYRSGFKPTNYLTKWKVRREMSRVSTSNSLNSSKCPFEENCDIGLCECECAGVSCDKEQSFHDNNIVVTDKQVVRNNDKQIWHYPIASSVDKLRRNKGNLSLLIETMNQPLTVCVEGNIGSGKTTFLKYFKKYPNVCVFDEPISKWRDCQGYNLLDLMYKDPRKWSLCFQSYVQLTMLDLHTKPIVQPIKMMERSIFSAQYCFVQNLRDEGLMEDPQYAVLSEWFNFSMANLPIKVDLIVYLRTDPEIAYERIGQRGRSEENSIKLEYLQSVHKHHEDWLIHKQKMLPCPVLTIDANTELADMTPNYLLCEEKMFNKVAVANC